MSSSVLETFFYLFKSDTTGVTQGSKEAKKTTDDLNKSIKDTAIVSEKLGAHFLSMAKQAGEALIAVFAVREAIHEVLDVDKAAGSLGRLAKTMQINVTDLDAWGKAVKDAGGDQGAFNDSLKLLAANMEMVDVKGTSRVKPFFDEIGVNMLDSAGKVKKALDVLPEIAKAWEKYTPQEQLGLGRKMGLDEGTIMLLQKGSKAVNALVLEMKEHRLVTKEDVKISEDFRIETEKQELAFYGLALSVGSVVMPVLTDMMKFFRENKEIITDFFEVTTIIIVARYIPAITSAAIATWALIAPYVLLAAGVALVGAAIVLVADDFEHFFKGQQSIIGYIIKWWREFEDYLGDSFHMLFDGLLNDIKEVFAALAGGAEWLNEHLGLKGAFGDINVKHSIAQGQQQLEVASSSPIAAQTSTSISNSAQSVVRKSDVTIQEMNINSSATNSDELANHVGGALTKQLRQVVNGFDNGVAM